MGWGRARRRSAVVGLAERRLAGVARQWRCPPARPDGDAADADTADGAPSPVGWDALAAEATPVGRPDLPRWSRSAARGLAVLLAVAVVVAGYWAWTGRPRAVATAPAVLATGAPLPGDASIGAPVGPAATPAPAAAGSPPATPALAAAGSPIAAASPPLPVPSAAAPATPVPQVVVHVTGLVARPGLVRLPLGARVADAVAEAGGVTRRRAADSVNLARVLVDGEQVVVGAPAGALGATRPATAASGTPAGTPMGPTPGSIDLNTAGASTLEELPGVGPVIAARIVAWRVANGAFRSVEELGEVSGIGDAVMAQVRDLVRV